MPLDPLAAVLLVTKRSQIIANHINMRPPQMRPVISGSSIVTVDFDRVTSKIYWADASQKKIWRSNRNGTDRQEVRQVIIGMYEIKAEQYSHHGQYGICFHCLCCSRCSLLV